ncbi:hypothetical protein M3Y97_00614100 [Aphelenchoides bicaudatus]|nr:hypothetical protein M3Y97_00614100 [Aphelenchoides bicaudatus]
MRSQATDQTDDDEGLVTLVQRKLFDNYHTVAYSLIIGTYIIAFAEYLYLRLVSLIVPARIVYRRTCDKHLNETILRSEFNYASTAIIFCVIGIFQIVCFFLLTISDKWLTVRRTFKNVVSLEEKLRNELVFSIKRVMFSTVIPSFLVYSMASSVVICAIFYMCGMRDGIESTLSQVIIHLFDALVIAYFIAFPVVCVIYHPKVRCRLRMCKSSVVDTPRNANNTNNSPVIHQNASAHLVAYRRSNGILDPHSLQVTIDNIETTI